MAFYSLSEAEQHIMDYMWAHADQEEIHLNEIMEYMETKGYVWKQQTAYSFVIRLKNKKILSSTKRGKRRYYSVNMSRKEFIAKGVQEYLNLAYDGSLLVFLRSLEGDHGLSEEHKQELQQFVKEQQEKEHDIRNQQEISGHNIPMLHLTLNLEQRPSIPVVHELPSFFPRLPDNHLTRIIQIFP